MARRTPDPTEIENEHLLLCEGKATKLVLGPFVRHHAILGFQPLDFGGNNDFASFIADVKFLPAFASQVRSIAIVPDAEEHVSGALRQVQNVLRMNGLPVPEQAGVAGITSGILRVGVFLMPDNETEGMLETLCMQSVQDEPAFACVEEFFRCVKERVATPPRHLQIHKARAQAYLATRETIEYHVGRAVDNGAWNFNHAAFAPLAEFLRALSA